MRGRFRNGPRSLAPSGLVHQGRSGIRSILAAMIVGGLSLGPSFFPVGCCCGVCMDYAHVTFEFDAWWSGSWLEFEVDGVHAVCRFDEPESYGHASCEGPAAIHIDWSRGRIELMPVGLPELVIARVQDEHEIHWEGAVELEYERYTECATRCWRADHVVTIE